MSMPVSASLAALSSPPGPEQPSAVPMPARPVLRSFAVLHRDVWRIVLRYPLHLLCIPAAIGIAYSLGSDLLAQGLSFLTTLYGPRISLQRANSNNSSEVWVGLLVEVLVLNVLHRLTQAHRVSPEKTRQSMNSFFGYWSVAWVYFLAFLFPLLGSVAIFVVLHFLLGEFGFRSGLLNEWGMGFCAVSVCVLLLICWLRYAFCGQVVVFEGLRGFAAMERSREYMRGQRLRIAVLTLAFPLLYLPLAALPLFIPSPGRGIPELVHTAFVGAPLFVLLTSLWTVFSTALYVDARGTSQRPRYIPPPLGCPDAAELARSTPASRRLLVGLMVASLGMWLAGGLAVFREATAPAPIPKSWLECRSEATQCERACEQGSAVACYFLKQSSLKSSDAAQLTATRRGACEGNVAEACRELGQQYATGEGVAVDAKAARDFYDRACRGQDWRGCVLAAEVLQQDEATEVNLARARELLQLACDHGEGDGCAGLGQLYQEGRGGKKDPAHARLLFTQGCESHSAESCFYLALSDDSGSGGDEAPRLARQNYEKACELGSAAACNNLGILYQTGRGGEVLETRAQASYEQACDGGLGLGCLNLARLLDRGAENAPLAPPVLQKFERACELDHGPACLLLARWLQAGQRVDPDPARGSALLQRACELGEAQGCVDAARQRVPKRRQKSASTKTGPSLDAARGP